MRKIEKLMLQAIEARKQWHNANTAVWYVSSSESGNPHGGRSEIYLHGNHIADYWHNSGELDVDMRTLRNWPSMTTRSRLRALGAKLVSIKGTLHLDGKSIYAE